VNWLVKYWRSGVARCLVVLLFLFCSGNSSLADDQPTEWEVKAAFLFNFAKFVDWPATKLPPSAPLIIGTLGEDPFGSDLEKTIGGKNVLGHPIEIRRYASSTDARQAHIVFIDDSEKRRHSQILKTLSDASVLTVGDTENFCEQGGMINFKLVANKVRFEINQGAAEKEGLKISSKLLSVGIVKK
jgi:hypothetical protein